MKKIFGKCIMAIGFLAFVGCSSMTIHSQHEDDVDFRQYATFNIDMQYGATDYLNDLDLAKLKNAVTRELRRRGYTQAGESADLTARFYFAEKAKKNVDAGNPNVKFYRSTGYYRPGMHGGYYNHQYYGRTEELSPHVEVYKYNEGTLVIEALDREKDQIIWQGIAVDTISKEITDTKKMEQRVNSVVAEIFKTYPLK